MSMQTIGKHDKNGKLLQPKVGDSMTKQAFKDETDINRLLARAQVTGTISHLNKFEPRYADFSDFDFFDAQLKLLKGGEIFSELPPEIRTEFGQSPAAFFAYVNDPANKDRLGTLLPALAEPGKQLLDLRPEASTADATAALAAKNTPDVPDVKAPVVTAPPAHSEPLAAPPTASPADSSSPT